jgi:hypothetical protein
MSTRQAVRGKVLAEITADIDDDGEWWFRAPQDPAIGVKKLPTFLNNQLVSCRNWDPRFF